MKKIFRVSKQGLTRCPQCARHIFLAEAWRETECHFCHAQLLNAAPATGKRPLRRLATRSNLIAAGLLSASLGMAACDDSGEPEPTTDAMMMVAPDSSVQPAYGEPAGDFRMADATLDAAPDPEPQPEYGAPAEPDAALEPAEDAGVQPDYGNAAEPEGEG
jgi:hypothetical protein